jgi:hypothetical protein
MTRENRFFCHGRKMHAALICPTDNFGLEWIVLVTKRRRRRKNQARYTTFHPGSFFLYITRFASYEEGMYR